MKKLFVAEGGYTPTEMLHAAVYEEDVATAVAAILAGADVDAYLSGTPLMNASRRGHVAMVKLLLAAGADVNYSMYEYLTPIMCAAAHGHTEVMKLLMAAGAPLSELNEEGDSAMELAALYGHPDAVALLLDAGAELPYSDEIWEPALSLAQRKRFYHHYGENAGLNLPGFSFASTNPQRCRAIELLLRHGAGGAAGESRLQLAVRSRLTDLAREELASGVPVDTPDAQGRTPLMEALLQRDGETAALLLRHGANPAARDEAGNTCLFYAATGGNKALCRRMLKLGNSVDAANRDGVTPLMMAAYEGHLAVMLLLLQYADADANAVTHEGMTALQYAVAHSATWSLLNPEPFRVRLLRMQLLLDFGADPNRVGIPRLVRSFGLPLHHLAAEGDIEGVKLLLARGAKPDCRNARGSTPLMLAVRASRQTVVEILLAAGADLFAEDGNGNNLLPYAVAGKNRRMTEALVRRHGFDVNKPRPGGYSLVGYAAAFHPSMVGLLLMLGADPLIEDAAGNTVLHRAAEHSRTPELIRLFARYRIPVNKRNNKGQTALQLLAAQHPRDEALQFALLLLQHGADPADYPELAEHVMSCGSSVTQQMFRLWQEH